MIRKILTPLDLSDHTDAATFRACDIAKKVDALITGLTVVDTDGMWESVALPFHAEMIGYPMPISTNMSENAAEKLDSAREIFESRCTSENVRFELSRLKGNPIDGILDLSRFSDLLIMGLRSHFHFETENGYGEMLAHVLDGISVPVLLTPALEENPIRRALIAFDGSPSSTRALQSFAKTFWPTYSPEVRIVTSTKDKEAGEYLLGKAADYLGSHGVKSISKELTSGSLQGAMEDRGLDWADIVVAGVCSKPPLKRFHEKAFKR